MISGVERQRSKHLEQLQEAITCATPYLDYDSHYEVSRSCHYTRGIIRRYYADRRSLDGGKRGSRLSRELVEHIIGGRLQALDELKVAGDTIPYVMWMLRELVSGLKVLRIASLPSFGSFSVDNFLPPDATANLRRLDVEGTDAVHWYRSLFGKCKFPRLEVLRVDEVRCSSCHFRPDEVSLQEVHRTATRDMARRLQRLEDRHEDGEEHRVAEGRDAEHQRMSRYMEFSRWRHLKHRFDEEELRRSEVGERYRDIERELTRMEERIGMQEHETGMFGWQVGEVYRAAEGRGAHHRNRMAAHIERELTGMQEDETGMLGWPLLAGTLRRVELRGGFAGRWFASMFARGQFVIEELDIRDMSGSSEPMGAVEGLFPRLENVRLEGVDAGIFFASFSESCAPVLEELHMLTHQELVGEVVGDFKSLRKVDVVGGVTTGWFGSLSKSCAPMLEELRIWTHQELVGEVVGDFKSLRKVDVFGPGASSCLVWILGIGGAPAVEELSIRESDGCIFIGRVVGDFPVLRTVTLRGCDASRWFSSISASCGERLEKLEIKDDSAFVGEVESNLGRLRDVNLVGNGAIRWFSSISERCAPTLMSLHIEEWGSRHPVVSVPAFADFSELRMVTLRGCDASRWFSSISASCGERLEKLEIKDDSAFVGEVESNLGRLRDVTVVGDGAIRWFSSISERCAPTLVRLRIEERGFRHPVVPVPGAFVKLQSCYCRHLTLTGGDRLTPREGGEGGQVG
eukprot:GHVU01084508.1.p1 GENE.GHVU01084508.1~~GHVU01084508.1.p1  ORF type:complete len:743 (+),score=86.71 GHVU01084508.1:542-2770(+)